MGASIWAPGSTITIDSASLLALFQIRGGYCSVVGGTADAVVLTPTSVLAAYAAGQTFYWIASGVNTGPMTVAISSLAAVALTKEGAVALTAGDVPAGMMVQATYDGTRLILGEVSSVSKSLFTTVGDTVRASAIGVPSRFAALATVAAHATTCNPWVADNVELSGPVVTFTGLADAPYAGAVVWIKSNAAHVWTHNAALSLPGFANYTSASGDWFRVEAITVNTFSLSIFKADGTAVVVASNAAAPNLLINPNWQIDQINEGALYTYSAATAVGPDGWSGSATGAGVFKLRTLADPDNAALKCLEITCTTADAAIAAADNYYIMTAIEGYDAAALQAGIATALPITVQFKFKSNVSGVYGISIANSALNRSYVGSFTVADANEAEYSVTLTMDTAGTWLYTNGVGLYLRISLAAGSNFKKATGLWGADNMFGTAGNANFMLANTSVAYLKRIQLIQSTLTQAYKPADIQKELDKCQRYYWKSFAQGVAVAQNAGINNGTISYYAVLGAAAVVSEQVRFPVPMRATPTVVYYNPSAANTNWRNSTDAADSGAPGTGRVSTNDLTVSNVQAAGDAVGEFIEIHATTNARLT